MDCACQGAAAGVDTLKDVGVLNAAQSPACHQQLSHHSVKYKASHDQEWLQTGAAAHH